VRRVLVVGASVAGLTAAEELRRKGFDGELWIVGDEPHLPYDRPPLSKQAMHGPWGIEQARLRTPDELDSLDANWLLGRRAVALRTSAGVVQLDDGREIGWDGLVIATGVSSRPLPGMTEGDPRNVYPLRTIDDACRLRVALASASRVVIVGGGLIGMEVAAAASVGGVEVVVVEALSVPLKRAVGAEVGERVKQLHEQHGVELRLSLGVAALEVQRGIARGVVLTDGSVEQADAVVVAIGSVPNTDWLAESGLHVADGVVCNEHCLAGPGVVAAGDVARVWQPALGRSVRFEHRTNAAEQGAAAARSLLGERTPFAPVPYFWTEQFDVRIRAYGLVHPATTTRIVPDPARDDRFTAEFFEDKDLVGGLTWNDAKGALAIRRRLASSPRWSTRSEARAESVGASQ
jgi:3-phenylpropionate/trans-cinnamate dioxygenase ferredoxin reductase component